MACADAVENKKESQNEFRFPVIIDNDALVDDLTNVEVSYHGNHNPLYFGKLMDTIKVDKNIGVSLEVFLDEDEEIVLVEPRKFEKYFLDWMSEKRYKYWDSVDLNIFIDTTQVIGNDRRRAFPVLIQNNHSDTINIGYGRYIPIVAEAKNREGEWKPIEEPFIYMCGVGLETIILPPEEFVVTSQLMYSGKFKTKLRLRMGNNYSQEFKGCINDAQFLPEW